MQQQYTQPTNRPHTSLFTLLASLSLLAVVTGCHKKPDTSQNAKPIAKAPPAPQISDMDLKSYRPNEAGAVMIVMYHRIRAEEKDIDLNRRPETFRKDLEDLYKRGYRPVNVSEFIDNKMDIPAGKTPVLLTFDDSLPTQFKLVTGSDGQPHIDPDCAVGILESFSKEHPDWKSKATFFVLPHEGRSGRDPFGQPESVGDKFAYLIKNGYEIANHTSTHTSMRGMSADKVQWELATAVRDIKQINPDAQMQVMALPYGNVPRKDVAKYLISGESNGIKYTHKAVLRAAWRPVASSICKVDKRINATNQIAAYNPYRLERVIPDPRQATKAGTLEFWMKYFDENPSARYISDGNMDVVAVPKSLKNIVDADAVKKQGKTLQLYAFSGNNGGLGGGLSVESRPGGSGGTNGGAGGGLSVEGSSKK